MSSRLGIAVIHYRTPEVALHCLERVRVAAPDAQVVLVDTAPEPDFEERLARAHPTVRFRPTANHSYAHSVNVGLGALDTDYLTLMNADVLVEPDTFQRLIAALDAEPRCGLVGPLALTPAGTPQPLGLPYGRFYRRLAARQRRGGAGRAGPLATGEGEAPAAGAAAPPGPARVEPPASVPASWLSGCLQLTRRAVWDASGGYDETFRFFNEDMDFCFRLAALGYESRLVDAPVVHLGGASTPTHPAFHLEGRRGGMLLTRRHRSAAFGGVHLAFLWAEALSGLLLARTAHQRSAHSAMLQLLCTGAWDVSPFGPTLDQRTPAPTGRPTPERG